MARGLWRCELYIFIAEVMGSLNFEVIKDTEELKYSTPLYLYSVHISTRNTSC